MTKLVTPRLRVDHNYAPGPPKRFAQGVGAAFSLAALIALVGFHRQDLADALVGIIVGFTVLESVFAFCMGCKVFAVLMRIGFIPADVCERCNNLQLGVSLSIHDRPLGPHADHQARSGRLVRTT